jgi:hypothetical protein
LATIRKRGKRWQVQVRRKGEAPTSRSFVRKEDAAAWARTIEIAIDRGTYVDRACLADLTLGDLLTRYCDTVSVRKRSHTNEAIILNAMIGRQFTRCTRDRLGSDVFSSYRAVRLRDVKPVTINGELGILQHVLDIARDEWALQCGIIHSGACAGRGFQRVIMNACTRCGIIFSSLPQQPGAA